MVERTAKEAGEDGDSAREALLLRLLRTYRMEGQDEA